MKSVMMSYEDFLLWKKYRYQIWKLKDILQERYGIDAAKIDDIDHNYGRKIDVYLHEEEELYTL